MDRRTVTLIWIGGVVLMVAVYAIGPQHFIAASEAFLIATGRVVSGLIDTLMWRGFELMRAAAIALYVVFMVLAVLAMRRGLRAGGMLLGVSVVFLLLVRTDWYDPSTKWLAAVVLTAIAAASMTKRLVHAMPPRDPANPWGFGRR